MIYKYKINNVTLISNSNINLFIISLIAALFLSAEYILLGSNSWIPYYAGGSDNIPTWMGIIKSDSQYSAWAPFVGGGVDRLSFWGSGDPYSLEIFLFEIFPVWFANGLYMVVQRFIAIFFTALVCRDQLRLTGNLPFIAGLLHAVFGLYCVAHLMTAPAVPMVIYILYALSSRNLIMATLITIIFGLLFSTVTSVAQGLPYLMFFIALYFLLLFPKKVLRIGFLATIFSLVILIVKLPILLALFANAPFSQRAVWPIMSVEIRSLFLGPFILWPESNLHHADMALNIFVTVVQGIAIIFGVIIAIFSFSFSNPFRDSAKTLIKVLALYFLVGSSLWVFLRDVSATFLPWVLGVQISRIIIVPSAFLNAIIIILTINSIKDLIKEKKQVTIFGKTFSLSFLILVAAIVPASLIMGTYQGFTWSANIFTLKYRWLSPALLATILFLIVYFTFQRNKFKLASGFLMAVLVALVVFPKFSMYQEYMLSDYKLEHFKVKSIDELKTNDDTLFRVASVLPLQPTYAYSQGLESIDGWILLYPNIYRQLWIEMVRPLVEKDPLAIPVFDPKWKYPQDHYVFMGIGNFLSKDEKDTFQMNFDSRFNISLLSLMNTKYILSDVKISSEYLRLIHSPNTPATFSQTERDYSVGRIINRWPDRKDWNLFKKLLAIPSDTVDAIDREVRGKDIFIYQNECFIPRFRFVSSIKGASPNKTVLQTISSASPNEVNQTAWLENGNLSKISDNISDHLAVRNLNVEKYSPDLIELSFENSGPGFLIIGNTWNPFWKARVNGELREILLTNHAQMGLIINDGDAGVSLTYEPPYLKRGVNIFSHESKYTENRLQSSFRNSPVCGNQTLKN